MRSEKKLDSCASSQKFLKDLSSKGRLWLFTGLVKQVSVPIGCSINEGACAHLCLNLWNSETKLLFQQQRLSSVQSEPTTEEGHIRTADVHSASPSWDGFWIVEVIVVQMLTTTAKMKTDSPPRTICYHINYKWGKNGINKKVKPAHWKMLLNRNSVLDVTEPQRLLIMAN